MAYHCVWFKENNVIHRAILKLVLTFYFFPMYDHNGSSCLTILTPRLFYPLHIPHILNPGPFVKPN